MAMLGWIMNLGLAGGGEPPPTPEGEAICVRASDATTQARARPVGRQWATDATPIHRARPVCK